MDKLMQSSMLLKSSVFCPCAQPCHFATRNCQTSVSSRLWDSTFLTLLILHLLATSAPSHAAVHAARGRRGSRNFNTHVFKPCSLFIATFQDISSLASRTLRFAHRIQRKIPSETSRIYSWLGSLCKDSGVKTHYLPHLIRLYAWRTGYRWQLDIRYPPWDKQIGFYPQATVSWMCVCA